MYWSYLSAGGFRGAAGSRLLLHYSRIQLEVVAAATTGNIPSAANTGARVAAQGGAVTPLDLTQVTPQPSVVATVTSKYSWLHEFFEILGIAAV